jgi:hypothetical protein
MDHPSFINKRTILSNTKQYVNRRRGARRLQELAVRVAAPHDERHVGRADLVARKDGPTGEGGDGRLQPRVALAGALVRLEAVLRRGAARSWSDLEQRREARAAH